LIVSYNPSSKRVVGIVFLDNTEGVSSMQFRVELHAAGGVIAERNQEALWKLAPSFQVGYRDCFSCNPIHRPIGKEQNVLSR
jgi:hypothetical protein